MANVKWSRGGKKWTLAEALRVGTVELMGMNTQERAELAQFLRNTYQLRERQFSKSGTTGYAMVKLKQEMEDTSEKLGMKMNPYENIVVARGKNRMLTKSYAERKNPQNALARYITLMQDFFSAKSSTVKGWRDIGEAQDRMLFGEKATIVPGRLYKKQQKINYKYEPAHRMTDQERILFWKVYDEASRAGWVPMAAQYAMNGEKDFATVWMTGDFKDLDFEEAYAKMVKIFDLKVDHLPEGKPYERGNRSVRGEGGDNNVLDENYEL